MNSYPLDRNVFGFETASQHYFGKHSKELKLHEAALLAALTDGFTRFSPTLHPERSLERRNIVLDLMAKSGGITPYQAEQEKREPLGVLPALSD
jgi:membrane peptidoglycan carboxypeptidase